VEPSPTNNGVSRSRVTLSRVKPDNDGSDDDHRPVVGRALLIARRQPAPSRYPRSVRPERRQHILLDSSDRL
jgi:hypothetical protein